MAQPMSKEEYLAFLAEGTRTGKVATSSRDGNPHVVPVWFILDGETIVFMTGATSVKGRRLLKDPHVALCVDDERPPFSFVTVQGLADARDNPPEMLDWSIRIAKRYMGEALAIEFGKRNTVDGELLVRVTPTKVIAVKALAE